MAADGLTLASREVLLGLQSVKNLYLTLTSPCLATFSSSIDPTIPWGLHWAPFSFLYFQPLTTLWFIYFYFIFFVFLGPHLWHMEVPGLGVESELQLLAYTTATATPDLSPICNLHHSSRQHWILNPLSEGRNRTCTLMDTSQLRFRWAMMGTPTLLFKLFPLEAVRIWMSSSFLFPCIIVYISASLNYLW